MSFFVCVSTHERRLNIADHFPPPLHVIEITEAPAGRLLLGGRQEGHVVAVTHRGCSTDIINRTGRTPDATRFFRAGLEHLVSVYPYVSVLVHWFRGDIHNEAILVQGKVRIEASVFIDKFPDEIVEDVKYSLLSGP